MGLCLIDILYWDYKINIMNIAVRLKNCPSCKSMNLFRLNGVSYENKFNSMDEWDLKKKFNCRKCKIELGLFVHNISHEEKMLWIDLLKCEDPYHKYLKILQTSKEKFKNSSKKYYETLDEINGIQNKIKLDKIKVKIKNKIINKGMFIRHVN